jgi:hypothetical protein
MVSQSAGQEIKDANYYLHIETINFILYNLAGLIAQQI